MVSRPATTLLAAALAASVLAGPAAAAPKKGLPDRARAQQALERVKAIKDGRGARTGFDLTPALAELARALPRLSGRDRRLAEGFLARPDETDAPVDLVTYSGAEVAQLREQCTADFCFHWTEAAGSEHAPAPDDTTPNNGVPDYVDQMTVVFQDEVFPCENATACAAAPGLGWREAPSDGDGKLDVYIANLGPLQIFGYNAVDPGQDGQSQASYMVMDNDYAEFGFADPLDPLRVTAAHEYNHALQNGYDAFQDTWMFEATATWAEEKVYPAIDDWLRYLPPWRDLGAVPMTDFRPDEGTDIKAYGSALFNHWIEGRHGAAAIRGAWENSASPPEGFLPDFAPDAYSAAIGRQNAFSEEFARFAAGVAEWRTPAGGFQATGDAASFGDMPRAADLQVVDPGVGGTLDNTTFALFGLPVLAAPAPDLLFIGELPAGTRGAIAVVGRRGGPDDGELVTEVLDLPNGGRGTIVLRDSASFGRITGVVANADVTLSGFDQSIGQWAFARDAQPFTARVAALQAPGTRLIDFGAITPTSATVRGGVNPKLDDTTYHFEFGRGGAFDQRTPDASAGNGETEQVVETTFSALIPETTYQYRLVATNRGGTAVSDVRSFTTPEPPDTTGPVLRTTVAKRIRRAVLVRRGLKVRVRSNEAARLSLKLVLDRATARRLKLRNRTIAKTSAGLGALDRTLKLRLTRKARRALRRTLKRAGRLTVTVSGVDAKGNRSAAVRRTVRFLR